jgi:hypothetical protein
VASGWQPGELSDLMIEPTGRVKASASSD